MISSVVPMKAILLAGGKGTRLRPLTIHTPKPIVPIFDRPFLHYQLDLLKQVAEIDEVILSLNYQPRRIEEMFGDGGDSGLGIKYVVEPAPLGTAGRGALRRRIAPRIGRRLQRRRADGNRSGGRHPAAPRAQGPRDDRADAGRQPVGVWPGRDRRRRQHPALSGKTEAGRDHLQYDQRRHLRARARHLRPHPERHALVDRTQLLPFADRTGRDLPAPTSIAATGSTSARRKSTCRSIATSWTAAFEPRPDCRPRRPHVRRRRGQAARRGSRPRRASKTA